jgi:hypothetical protein
LRNVLPLSRDNSTRIVPSGASQTSANELTDSGESSFSAISMRFLTGRAAVSVGSEISSRCHDASSSLIVQASPKASKRGPLLRLVH